VTTLALAFMPSLRISFYIGALLSIIAAILASMAGTRIVREIHVKPKEKPVITPESPDDPGCDIVG
jgi:hypothetical protein